MQQIFRTDRAVKSRSSMLALAVGGGALTAAQPAQALLFNGLDYQLIGPDVYQVSSAQGSQMVPAAQIPDAVRDALEVLGGFGTSPGIVPNGAFSASDALML